MSGRFSMFGSGIATAVLPGEGTEEVCAQKVAQDGASLRVKRGGDVVPSLHGARVVRCVGRSTLDVHAGLRS
ncbi:hypothetical protein HYG77_38710 (plasmid) [Rhodococcus sp. ZPP]|nr:hypothetical protein HYG77_38710 [Rhodococcus sp. ZPP]